MSQTLTWTYKGKTHRSELHRDACSFCRTMTVVKLPKEILDAQPDETTHACVKCGHGFGPK